MGTQWAPVVIQGDLLINVHTKRLEGMAHQLSVNVKYIQIYTQHVFLITHLIYHMHNKYIFNMVKEIKEIIVSSLGET